MDNIWMIRVTVENWIPIIQDGALFWLLHVTFVYNSILTFMNVPNTKKCIYDSRNCIFLFPKLLPHRSFYSRKKNNSSKTSSNTVLFHMLQRPDLSSLISFLFLYFFFAMNMTSNSLEIHEGDNVYIFFHFKSNLRWRSLAQM